MRIFLIIFMCLLLGNLLPGEATAAQGLRLAPIFQDHMVVQRNRLLPVWGFAGPLEKISVSIASQKRCVIARDDGSWSTSFDPIAGGPVVIEVKDGPEILSVKDIQIGEVFLCAGQSNMVLPCNATKDCNKIDWTYPERIRVFSAAEPTSGWNRVSDNKAASYSAVAMSFAARLNKAHPDMAIGIVQCAFSGSPIQSWIPRTELPSDGAFESPDFPPGSLFDKVVSPLIHFPFKAVIWYQGESDIDRAHLYRKLFSAMSVSWRRLNEMSIPFFVVQLPGIGLKDEQTCGGFYRRFREVQLSLNMLPHTYVLPTIDADSQDANVPLHSQFKKPIGEHLAMLTDAWLFGAKTGFIPRLFEVDVEDGRICAYFSFAEQGLCVQPAFDTSFEIAGADGQFRKADVLVENDHLVFSSKFVKTPAFVRYAFCDRPVAQLFSRCGMPISPFRTDKFASVTRRLQAKL